MITTGGSLGWHFLNREPDGSWRIFSPTSDSISTLKGENPVLNASHKFRVWVLHSRTVQFLSFNDHTVFIRYVEDCSNGGYLKRLLYRTMPDILCKLAQLLLPVRTETYYSVSFKDKIKEFRFKSKCLRPGKSQKVPRTSVTHEYATGMFLERHSQTDACVTDGSSRLLVLFCNYKTVRCEVQLCDVCRSYTNQETGLVSIPRRSRHLALDTVM